MKFFSRFWMAALIAAAVPSLAGAQTPAYTISPAPGSEVESFSSFRIDFPDADITFAIKTFLNPDREGEPGRDWDYNDQGHNDTIPGLLLTNIDSEKDYWCKIPVGTPNSTGGTTFNCQLSSVWLPPFTESGHYILTLQNMCQTIDGEEIAIDDITASYTIVYPYEYILSPSVEDATDLQGLTINFPGLKLGYWPNSRIAMATLEGPRTTYECEVPEKSYSDETGTTFKFTFSDATATGSNPKVPETIAAAGNYKLTVRYIYIDEEYIDIPWIYTHFVLDGSGAGPAESQMDPATMVSPENSYVPDIAALQLTWGGTRLQLVAPSEDLNELNMHYSTIPAYVEYSGDDTKYPVYPFLWANRDSEEGIPTSLMMEFVSLMESYEGELPYGTYTVTIPAGIVKNNAGLINPEQTVVLHKVQVAMEEPSVFPPMRNDDFENYEYHADQLTNITLSWGGTLVHNDEAPDITVGENMFGATDPIPAPFGTGAISISSDNTSLVMDFSTLAPGNWEIVVPEGYVIISPSDNVRAEDNEIMINDVVTLNYIIIEGESDTSGIFGFDGENETELSVYTLDGVKVRNVRQVNALDNGIYVINGKKTVIIKR